MKLYTRQLYRLNDLKVSSKITEPRVMIDKFDYVGESWDMFRLLSTVKLDIKLNNEHFAFGWQQHLRVQDFFTEIRRWFFDKEMENLFFITNTGEKMFNSDFDYLRASVYSGQQTHQFMEAIPMLLDADGIPKEGIALTINRSGNIAYLTTMEFSELMSIFFLFNFQSELQLLLYFRDNTNTLEVFKNENQTRI